MSGLRTLPAMAGAAVRPCLPHVDFVFFKFCAIVGCSAGLAGPIGPDQYTQRRRYEQSKQHDSMMLLRFLANTFTDKSCQYVPQRAVISKYHPQQGNARHNTREFCTLQAAPP
jgi:hypothetical protein